MRDASPRWIFWSALWLAVLLVGAKTYYLGMTTYELVGGRELFRWVAAISYPDALFAALMWVCARAILGLTPAGGRRVVTGVAVLAAAAFLLYGAASVLLFGTLDGFPTYPLVMLSRHVPLISSSIFRQLTTGRLAALAAVVGLHLALVYVAAVVMPLRGAALRVAGAIVVLASIYGWVTYGHDRYIHSPWAGRQDKHVAESAHWVFASSWWRVIGGRATATLTGRFEPADLQDFEPVTPAAVSPAPQGQRPPNVILLVLESTAARWTSLYGGVYNTTPVLAAESAHSLVFDNVYAHIGRSSNSFVAMLMSRYPQIDNRDITVEYPRLSGTALSTLFRASGYRTGYLTPSDLAWADWRAFLEPRGFDDIQDLHNFPCTAALSEWGVEDRCMVDQVVQFIGQAPGRPFFLMAWTTQTHYPYSPTPDLPAIDFKMEPGPDQYDLGHYLNVLHETDRQLARMFDAIRRAGIEQDTLVVITGDHGQAFGYPHNSYGQGRTAYEEDVHVPLMLWFPRLYSSGMRSTTIGSHVDIAPTIAELTGIRGASEWQGRSLLQPGHMPRAYFYVAEDHFAIGVREDGWKYVFDLREGTDELYDLARDPTEQRNVVAAEPVRVARLRERLTAWMEANRRQYGR